MNGTITNLDKALAIERLHGKMAAIRYAADVYNHAVMEFRREWEDITMNTAMPIAERNKLGEWVVEAVTEINQLTRSSLIAIKVPNQKKQLEAIEDR